ncbi:UDP-glycosyltransferase 73C1-like [Momordica charantia]|uniref:Glycosyltransferase n=1 Tax=Momordica charantia TaxID=3673 RepID=A0A6J1E3W7_MOMCH|nr:UDP-glycosyltransferase 73C1-like [Momordica charantia]
MAMASPHFVLFPFMAQGHMIPMIDLAKLLARRGAIISFITTPRNAARNYSVLARAINSGLRIHVRQLDFPSNQVGLPEGCENLDLLPSYDDDLTSKFFQATFLLREPWEKLVEQLIPRPTCIITDTGFPWTLPLSLRLHIPRLVYYTHSCLYLLIMRSIQSRQPLLASISDDSEYVTLSDLPHAVQFLKSQLSSVADGDAAKFLEAMEEADAHSHGVVINIFEEMEAENVAAYRKHRKSPDRVWCVGPVSLCSEDKLDMAQRGNRACIDEAQCMNWLDAQRPSSVVYVSLGSLCNLSTAQLIEMGSGLAESKKPFIWVVRKEYATEEFQKWATEYDLEGKTEGRGLVIQGWAPQVLILTHSAIGCFLTHCGWNSCTEAISAGVPMITWPIFGDQNFNKKLIVEILRIGVGVGVETAVDWAGKAEKRALVKRDKVREAIEMAMDGDGSEEMRERCKQLAEKAKRALQEGGSSHLNLKLLIQDIVAYGTGCQNGNCS